MKWPSLLLTVAPHCEASVALLLCHKVYITYIDLGLKRTQTHTRRKGVQRERPDVLPRGEGWPVLLAIYDDLLSAAGHGVQNLFQMVILEG